MTENKQIFDAWKYTIEDVEPIHQLDCLRAITIDIANICNMHCPFCPIGNGWKSKYPNFISLQTIQLLKKQLDEIKYKNNIVLAGKGEPTLHPKFIEILRLLSNYKLILITNGSIKDNEYWKIVSSYCNCIKVSCHEWEKLNDYKFRFSNIKNVIFRNHDVKTPELTITNRGGVLQHFSNIALDTCCNYPFYHLTIQTDGTYEYCNQNWNEDAVHTMKQLADVNIADYFCNYMDEIRKNLAENRRQCCKYCKNCSCNGSLIGQKFVDFWKKHNA